MINAQLNNTDKSLVTAARLGEAHRPPDPFPYGSLKAGTRGLTAKDAPNNTDQHSFETLRSIDSGLPDHIIEELWRSYHAGDVSLYDYLGIFDERLQKLQCQLAVSEILVAAKDVDTKTPNFIDRFARLSGGNNNQLGMLVGHFSRSRNLRMLKKMLSWWCARDVTITSNFRRRRSIDSKSHTQLGPSGQNNRLGHGALIGKFGQVAQGSIQIEISCPDHESYKNLVEDQALLDGLYEIITGFLREKTSFSLLAIIPTASVPPPQLSAQKSRTMRLGPYHRLGLRHASDARVKIKIRR